MTTKKSINLDATIYAADSKKAGSITLPEAVFGLSWNSDLVHQVVTAMQANARQSSAHTKDRSEVSGSNKKPWAQKGTGRARHGSTRSPIWRTGGVTFGPRNEKDYSQKINRKMKVKALFTVLSRKFKDGEVLFVSDLAMSEPKTKDARATLTKLGSISGYEAVGTRRKNAAYVILSKADANVKKSFQNMGNVLVGTVNTVNPVDLLTYKYVIFANPEESVKVIESKNA
ncbi:MAG: 50S ribosomal protein L4 [Candidatus Lloydbacteria bacterium RIFOXYC12_FULL_46_25]|uniref:Large ribosomal subunit protein uL4 n=1 Tax=Candidatus Lloydbacteria bacterium RIFOXYC12_FULL_46_25 TaxID=1798670 RepID=A0A1G2DW07_9BACT|nr:MAG: 50S ribosomal protein L4 [Candidatus Lloydbacteria bacterium RIFOXYC12_FULL_46_25]